jgi:hypothetical protein
LVQDRGGGEFQTAGNLLVDEDLKRDTNPAEKGGRPKDIFEMGSSKKSGTVNHLPTLNGRSK